MPIIEKNSPLTNLRSDLQKIIANYPPDLVEKILLEMGVMPSELPTQNNNPTYEEVCSYYLTSPHFLGLSKSSQKTYSSELNQFSGYISSKLGNSAQFKNTINPQFLMEYLSNHHINTKSKKSAFLRSFLRAGLKEFYKEPLDELKNILKITWRRGNENEIDSLPKPLTKSQLSEVISLAAASRNGLRNHAIVMTFLTSGIRLNELINLQIGDFDIERRLIRVVPKGHENCKKARNINLLGVSILQNYIDFTYQTYKKRLSEKEFKELYIFSASNGKRSLDPKTVESFVSKLYDQCKTIPKIQNGRRRPFNVHTFRHCFAVYGLEGGLDIFTISKLLGHKDIKSTAIYLDIFNDQLSKAVETHPFAQNIGEDD